MNVTIVKDVNLSAAFCASLLVQWEMMPYAELSVLTAWLKALGAIHQSHHWQSSADPFYGDHLLYQRLYEDVFGETDRVAEKAVGMGSSDLVCPCLIMRQANIIIESSYFTRPGIPQPTDLAARSLHVEKCFLEAIEAMSDSLETKSLLTTGVDNMLAELADKHEEHTYLLKQRCSVTSL